MANYYKRGDSYYHLDLEKDLVVCITNNNENKAIAISEGYPNSAQIMDHSFSSSLSQSQRGGYPVLVSNSDEFESVKGIVKDYLVSHSIIA